MEENKSKLVLCHLHGSNSALDGLSNLKEAALKLKELGYGGGVITDHGTLSGTYDWYKACNEVGIKPILGCEFYMAINDYKIHDNSEKERTHLTVFAKNKKGWQNLCRLNYLSYKDGFYYKNRIDYKLLFEHKEGLIVLSGCASSQISKYIKNDEFDKAKDLIIKLKEEFKDDFYLELQSHDWEPQKKINKFLRQMSKEFNIKTLVGADSHYVNHSDQYEHEIILCIGTASNINDKDRMTLKDFDLSIPDPKDLEKEFSLELENSKEIYDKCNFDFKELFDGHVILPDFTDKDKEYDLLRRLVFEGYKKKYTGNETWKGETIQQRIHRELETIKKMDYVGYLLIVSDICRWCKKNDILTGPGRGCFLPGSIVKTKKTGRGEKIEKIKPNDMAYTHDGTLQKILNIFEYEVKNEECIELKLSNNKKIKCTSDHLILTKNRGYVEAKNLTYNDILLERKLNHEKVILKCKDCGKEYITNARKVRRIYHSKTPYRNYGEYQCISCYNKCYVKEHGASYVMKRMSLVGNSPEARIKAAIKIKENWKNPQYKKKMTKALKKVWTKEKRDKTSEKVREMWKDPNYNEKVQQNIKKGFLTGKFYSEKSKRNIFYQSSYELKFLTICENDSKIVFFDRCKDRVPYISKDNKEHSYFPDFIVKFKNGEENVCEVKSKWLLEDFLKYKGKAAKNFYGDKFKIIDEDFFKNNNDIIHNDIKILDKKTFKYTGKVYDLEVENCHNYLVSNVTVHNSVGGSVVAYCLDITSFSPLIEDIVFERFVNEDRYSPCDIDLDFQEDKRHLVIEYITKRYGEEFVSGIGIYSKLKAKSAFKDVARTLGMSFEDSLKATKEIYENPLNVDKYLMVSLKGDGDKILPSQYVVEQYNSNPLFKEVFDEAVKLEGKLRQIGTHACGKLISPINLTWNIPLMVSNGDVITQWDHPTIESLTGLQKFDVLGLSNLKIAKNTIKKMRFNL